MKEIIIDGVVYEAYEKKDQPFKPEAGDFIVCTKPAFNFWIVYKVLFIVIKGKKVAMVAENSGGNLCIIDRVYSNFLKIYKPYIGEPGAHSSDYEWWVHETS